ncbi:hypothetical protein DFJ74DRAFT_32383 [Hyaloraphidium curvatum]|nr:hypothetical protein DFJ74DRAFT_32383 [Hyaloraphidium curvatum]
MAARRGGFASPTDRGLLITAGSTVLSRALIRELAELRDALPTPDAAGDAPQANGRLAGLGAHGIEVLRSLRVVASYRSAQKMPEPPLPGVSRNVVLEYDHQETFDSFEFASGGVTELVWIVPPTNANRLQQFKRLMDFCVRSARPSRGTRYIVMVSALQPSSKSGFASSDDHPFFRAYLEMERQVQKSGIPFTILRCCLPYQHTLLDFVKAGALAAEPGQPIPFKMPLGAGSFSPVSSRTVASVAAHLFLNFPNRFMNRTLDCVGPESMSGLAIASAASRGLGGLPIRFSTCTREDFAKWMIENGIARNPTNVDNVLAVLERIADGRFASMTDAIIKDVLGSGYRPYRLADHFAERKEEVIRALDTPPLNADKTAHGEKPSPQDFDPDHPSTLWWTPLPSKEVGVAMNTAQWNSLYGPQMVRKWRDQASTQDEKDGPKL